MGVVSPIAGFVNNARLGSKYFSDAIIKFSENYYF